LNVELYLHLENSSINDEKSEIVLELEHIHNKMIFDSFNESLDSFRPFGLKGQPYPWKSNIKFCLPKPINEETMVPILEKAKEKTLQWASNMCGYIGEKDE